MVSRNSQNEIDKLMVFRQRDKFSEAVWEQRGLNTPSIKTNQELTASFDGIADNLLKAVESNATKKEQMLLLKGALLKLKASDYDTEEKEFICDLFYELSVILKVDIKDVVSNWLYGNEITLLSKLFKRQKQTVEATSQNCTKCKAEFKTLILRKDKKISDAYWIIVQCSNCKEYNIVDLAPQTDEFKFENCTLIETLSKAEFTIDSVNIRLEQIKTFRRGNL